MSERPLEPEAPFVLTKERPGRLGQVRVRAGQQRFRFSVLKRFDVKVLKEIIRLRKQDQDERDEHETLLDVHMRAMESAGPQPIAEAPLGHPSGRVGRGQRPDALTGYSLGQADSTRFVAVEV